MQGGLTEVQNEDLGPKWRLAPGVPIPELKNGTRPCCGERYCWPIYPLWVGIPGKLLFSRYQGVNVFVGVGNDLPAALPNASPRLKILMVPHWCCRVTPREGYPGCRYPGKYLVLEKLGVKVQGGLGEVQNEDLGLGPRGAYPRGLRLGHNPVVVIGIVAPFTPPPPWVGIPGKLLFSRYQGGKCVRRRG